MSDEILYNPVAVADRIKEQAKRRNVQLKDMLKALDLNTNSMSSLRHGKMISSDRLARIADYLDCSVDYLLGRTDDISSPSVPVSDTDAQAAILEAARSLSNDELKEVLRFIQFLRFNENTN